MKTAEPRRADAAGPSGRRAQPVRQTRTNPPRTTSAPSRAVGGRESLGGGRSHDQPIDIFPAITHFTDAITALPKDLVRHFTLLKEVDAKIFAPEETLFQFVDAALKSSPPEPRSTRDGSSSVAPTSTPMSAQNSSTDHALGGHRAPGSLNESHASTVFDLSSVPRRNLFLHTAFKIQEMLVSLEEKNHVISTANDALSKQLARINDVWPHLENEFSDEAKWGSTSHWAYPENRINRANQAERSRRDGAAFITAAAQHLQVEEAAARSDARKQALMAKKGLKNQHHDSDADDHENKQKAEPPKKAQGASKARKGAEPATPVGLGITTSTNGNPPSKRRKVENNNKTVNGGQPMERAMSSVYGGNAPKPRAASPRATPAPEPTKKRKALPTANGISKKSKTAVAATVAATVAPLIPSPTPQPHQGDKPAGRGSPAPPAAVPRPASSRARQNSIQSSAENGRPRPASSASSRPNGVAVVPPEVPIIPNGPRASAEPKTLKESTTVIKTEPNKEETNPHPPNAVNGVNKKENPPKTDDAEPIEPTHHQAQTTTTTTTTVVTTKSGRASKPSTPAIGSFPDSTPRSRAARNVTTTTTTTATTTTAKRSHKKGASQHAIPTRIVDEDTNSSGHGDDEGDVDADEPLYCYCNGVSYGEMVACDADDCEREWFHLDCVGLKAAPPSNMKWYCDNCKDRIKTGKKVNGR